MADSKISQLSPITGANMLDSDQLPVARAATTENFSVTRAQFFQSMPSIDVAGDVTLTGTVDGRDVSADGTKLDGIEAGADVTDTANVTAAGALMDSELTNIAAVKALDQGVATTDSPTFVNVTASTLSGNGASVTNVDAATLGGDSKATILATAQADALALAIALG